MLARSRSRFRGRVQAASFLAEMARYGATDVWDFTKQQYIRNGVVGGPGLSFSRASVGYAQQSNGLWRLFASNTPRITDLGYLTEPPRTNWVLFSRDLSNAAWTATNVTVARNQVGIDGTANSACSLTATAGNGTVLQAITLTSAARSLSFWVRRITGSGTVEITHDNGATWSAVTVTSAWTRVTTSQTLANPTVGIRIATASDAIAVDFAQLEEQFQGAFPSSPIATEGTAATRAQDTGTVIKAFTAPITMLVEYQARRANNVASDQDFYLALNDGSGSNTLYIYNVVNGVGSVANTAAGNGGSSRVNATFAADVTHKAAVRAQTDNFRAAVNGTLAGNPLPQPDTTYTQPGAGVLNRISFGFIFGVGGPTFVTIRRAAIISGGLTDAQLQAITT